MIFHNNEEMTTSFQGQDTAGEPGSLIYGHHQVHTLGVQLNIIIYQIFGFAIQIIIENEPWSEGIVLLPSGSGYNPKCMEIFY